jgi:hypothetical protein
MTVARMPAHAAIEDTAPGGVPPRVRTRRWWRRNTAWIFRWSTTKTITVFSAIGLAAGPAVGFCFDDQLRPPLEPYLQPLKGALGVGADTAPLVPIPTFPPDPTNDVPTVTVTVTPEQAPVAPPQAGTVRRAAPAPAAAPRPPGAGKMRRPVVAPAAMGQPAGAATTKASAAIMSSTPKGAAPPVTPTTTKEATNEPGTTADTTPPPGDQPDTTSATASSTTSTRHTTSATTTSRTTGPATTATSPAGAATTDDEPTQGAGVAGGSGDTHHAASASSGTTTTDPT